MPRRTDPDIRVTEPVALGAEPVVPRQRAHLFPEEAEAHWQGVVLLALFAFVPLVLSKPGQLVLDTDDRLFLDPAGALTSAAERWNPISALGSVRDKTFDPAFPMSPWFWLADGIGLPDWLAQRLWVATILLAAGVGFVFLLRTMNWTGRGWMVGALAYQCSPYVLSYAGTTSGVLLAWAGLPWVIGFTNRSVTAQDWRNPARCAIVVALVASANLPAALYLSIGPAAWVLYAVVGARTASWTDALRGVGRITALGLIVSLWWMTSFIARPGDALQDIRANDPVEQVAGASTSTEVSRGLGAWQLYADDATVAIPAGADLQSSPWLIALGFVVPAIALTALIRVRFTNRLFFVSLLAVGTILAAGPRAGDGGEPVERAMRNLANHGVGALTNPSSRAMPLMWLGIAVGIAAAVRRMCDLAPRAAGTVRVMVGGAVLAGVVPLVTGGLVDGPRTLPDGIPEYWHEAAAVIDEMHSDKNILELPSMPRLGYTWGSTNRPISYSLFDRPVGLLTPGAASEPATAEVLTELDERIQRGDIAPRDIAPIARLLAADTIVVRADGLDDGDRAGRVRALLAAADPHEITLVGEFGSTSTGAPALAVYEVAGAPDRVRAVTPDHLVAMAGSASGVIDLVQSELLGDGAGIVVPVNELVQDDFLSYVISGTPFVLTDSRRPVITADGSSVGGSVAGDAGGAQGGQGAPTPSPSEPTAAGVSTIVWEGIDDVTARPPAGEPADPGRRPALVVDGDRTTAWVVGAGRSPVGATITIDLDEPIEIDEIRVRQPSSPSSTRLVTGVQVFAGYAPGDVVPLNRTSRSATGQVVPIDHDGPVSSITIHVTSVEDGPVELGAGFSEITIPGVEPREIVRLPDDLGRLSDNLGDHPVTVTLSRWTAATTAEPDPETLIDRRFTLPVPAQFTVRAIARDVRGTDCRDDLIRLDGAPVRVRAAEQLSPRLVTLEPCGDPVQLSAGDHELRTSRSDTATIDRVVLAPEPIPIEEYLPVGLDVTETRDTSLEIDVPAGASRFWLIEAASYDAGWEARLDGAVADDLRPVNGFAFALPLSLSPDGESHEIRIRWTPQRSVNVAALVSAAGLLLAGLVAVVRPRRRSAEAQRRAPHRIEHLRYVHPLVVVIVSLGVFGLSAGPVPGIVAGLVALLLEQRPHLFDVAAWVPFVLLAGAGVGRAVWQATAAPEPGPEWPGGVPVIDVVVWSAVALTVAIAFTNSDNRPLSRPASRGRSRRRGRHGTSPTPLHPTEVGVRSRSSGRQAGPGA